VACAVLGRPSIVIADEPTAELDSASADRVLDAFADLAGEQGAFVLSSHGPRVVERSDHLLRLDRAVPWSRGEPTGSEHRRERSDRGAQRPRRRTVGMVIWHDGRLSAYDVSGPSQPGGRASLR
jgi:ABC-type multidrug transport system ATPase subunit